MKKNELILVIDFGGQYNQLVARRVRECNVYCEIYSYRTDLSKIKEMNPMGIILTGGPSSCYEENAATCSKELFEMGVPVLGLCYGAQLMQFILGGEVKRAAEREYGKTRISIDNNSPLFAGVPEKTTCWMSHFDLISQTAPGFKVIAHTENCPAAAVEDTERNLYGIQFHPEVVHTPEGSRMLYNFVRGICGCNGDWKMDSFVQDSIQAIREKVGSGKVLCALSGGVDSSVAAVLMSKAVGQQLTCVFVDHGLLRKNEGDEVEEVFGEKGDHSLNFIRVNAQDRFYVKLAGVDEPEQKRKIIGAEFIRVFEEEAKKIGAVDFLVQGTIYPDVVESGLGGESAVIKSHHNVGGLPDHVEFREIIEPLRNLFKDEVRKVGLELGIPGHLVFRQPFPGPGLGIRIIGDVTSEKVRIVQDADFIFREEVAREVQKWRESASCVERTVINESAEGALDRKPGETPSFKSAAEPRSGELSCRRDSEEAQSVKSAVEPRLGELSYRRNSEGENPPWMPDQYFAALSNMRSVGVMGDERTYDYAVVLRAVKTIDFMTAEASDLPWELLQRTMNRIVNEVRGVNRVLVDVTSKPPGTVEME